MKRVVKRMEQQQNEHQAEPSSPNTSTRSKLDDLGEYVDFEEIKDDKT